MMKHLSRRWAIAPLYAALFAASTQVSAANDAIELNVAQPPLSNPAILVKDGRILITRGGTYRLTGQSDNGQIWVNTGDEKVTLQLDNIQLSNAYGSALYIEEAGDVDVELAPNSNNRFEDHNHSAEKEGEAKQNAPIYSKADLKIIGAPQATLTIVGRYKDGIVSKDDLDIRHANISIESIDDGLYGQDSVDIRDSKILIKAGDDGIKADNAEREDKGFVYLEGSNIQVFAKDDGIKGVRRVDIMSGTVRVEESYEGIESRNITIHGGDIFVKSEDDALNISDGSGADKASFGERMKGFFKGGERPEGEPGERPPRGERPEGEMGERRGGGGKAKVDGIASILGGRVHIQAGGDGFDSNGDAMMSGGELFIEGPTSGRDGYIDVDGFFKVTGGRLFAMGSGGMAQAPSNDSTQPAVQINLENTYTKGATVMIRNQQGSPVFKQVMPMDFQSFTISEPEFTLGQTYQVQVNDEDITTVTLDTVITQFGNTGRGGPRGERGEKKGWW
ncbi:carbohydrate-binding domain-containing protein [Marinomonas ostreistagni]|uniref:Carbohydrate-binding domain-containing protein n=1 Tax=Marinomonas ostreistagni TaxID=359209 RepID=A0ABS0ZBH4_9GAMM|nr:carbohydrate-binding domain-containing protein [Marinomonas ostreistagni]MBJ7551006.1 carbohydrate-binding domain-containing protein [Marinomonas ostreistagni]